MKQFFILSACFILCLHCRADSVDKLLQSANSAMDNGLWSVASSNLVSASKNTDLTPEDKSKILSLLAETYVRDNQPKLALEILDLPEIAKLPNTAFWKAQALAGSGNFREATSLFLEITKDPQNPFFSDAALTAASLQLSLSEPDQALTTLELVNSSNDPAQRSSAILRRAEILLNLQRYEQARAVLNSNDQVPAKLKPLSDFLDASLAIQEKSPEKAELLFSTLLSNPQYQSLTQFSLAALGKAEALAALNKQDAATEALIDFLKEHPDSPLLGKIFSKISSWLPSEILTEDHPTLVALSDWVPNPTPEPTGIINTNNSTASAAIPTKFVQPSDISIIALYTKATSLRRINNATAKQQAYVLLRRLLVLAPTHYLSPRSLLTIASWNIEDGRADNAFTIYESLLQNSKSPTIQGEAAFNAANIAYSQGDKTLASSLFEQASNLLTGQNSETALLNSSLAKLSSDSQAPIQIQHTDPGVTERVNAQLSLEQALENPDPAAAKNLLDEFLRGNPDHPRATEARIAMIEAALALSPPDISLAKAHIDTIKSSQTTLAESLAPRFALAELRLLSASKEHEQSAILAKEIVSRFQNTPIAAEASLIEAKSLFRSGNYYEARLILEKIAANDPTSQQSQAALLLAARSAALGATATSREEALTLFDKSISINGPLKSLAILEKSRLLIDLNRVPEAISTLENALKNLPVEDPAHFPTGLLLGEAIYANGNSDPNNISRSLEIYDELLKQTSPNTSDFLRLQYLRGISLEKLPKPDDPTQTRLEEALATYFSVLDRPTDPPPAEWEWFERSGFRALALLENEENWNSAISIADKISSFGGPRSEEAATRAKQLRLKHQIWDE